MLSETINIKNNNNREIVVVPNMESVPEVEAYFESRAEQLGIPMAFGMKINIIIDEIYSNVVHYSGASMARLGMNREEDIVSITFIDNGMEYNPLEMEAPDVTLSAEERNIGGLGIFMVKNMAKSMDYERTGEENVLIVKMKMDQ